jgi:hypothetical protein
VIRVSPGRTHRVETELGETSELTDLFVVNHEIPYA